MIRYTKNAAGEDVVDRRNPLDDMGRFPIGLASELADALDAANADRQRLREALQSLRRVKHDECEDCWYSCPMAEYYCGQDDTTHCNCGLIANNARIDAALSEPQR